MGKKSKILLIILAVALIISGVYMILNNENMKKTNENGDLKNSNEVQQAINDIKNEVKNEIKNNVEENTTVNNNENITENKGGNTAPSKAQTDTAQTGEEDRQKAINMAKEEWGKDDNVSFKIDEQTEDGKFIVSVVDKQTTNVIFWYSVDVKNNTIEEK